ncbi:MAG: ParA family protein [Blastocatellia bacterium]
MPILSLSNQKGGVGKTASAVIIAAELAGRGYRTLLIDGDPQANATSMFIPANEVEHSLIDAIFEMGSTKSIPLEEAIVSTQIKHLDLVPSNISLARFESIGVEHLPILRKKLTAVKDRYDFILIDNPPTLGKLLLVSLMASDYTLVPVSANPMGTDGLTDLIESHQNMRDLGSRAEILGMFTTLFDTRIAICGASHEQLKKKYAELVFDTIIHRNSKIEESPAFMKPVQAHAPQSRGAKLYSALTDEILLRLEMPLTRDGGEVLESRVEVGS